jgi:hypothetical protein
MNLHQLICEAKGDHDPGEEVPFHPAEENFPLIYDIVKAKLAAGQVIRVVFKHDSPARKEWPRLAQKIVTCVISDTDIRVRLYWDIPRDGDRNPDKFRCKPVELEEWKLTKKDGYWELFIP